VRKEKMSVTDEIRQRVNKKRWERWRARQDKEREKTYFYCWDEVVCKCDEATQINPVKETNESNYKEYFYKIQPKCMAVKENETVNIYLTAHLYTIYLEEWIEAGAQRAINSCPTKPWPNPRGFTYVSIEYPAFKPIDDEGPPSCDKWWPWHESRKFRLTVNPDTGDYSILQQVDGEWKPLRSGTGMQKKLCNADMAEEYFSHTYYYTESCVDAVREAELVTGDGVLKDFDEVPYRCW